MKKVLALLLALSMVFALVACGGNNNTGNNAGNGTGNNAQEPDDGGNTAEPTTYKIGVAIYQFDDNFMTLFRNELERYFKEELSNDQVTYELTTVDGKNDMATQTDQIRNFITQGMDLIICNLVQTSSADTIIDLVVDADIPLVLINREPLAYDADGNPLDESYAGILDNPKVCYVGADARQSGTYQGEIVLDLDDKGDINGDGKISYIMIQGDPENIDAKLRTEYSVKALTDAGMTVEQLDLQRGDWDRNKGQEIAQNDLAKFGDQIEVVFCNNDDMAIGALQAIQAAGRTVNEDIYLVGVDALDAALNEVVAGNMTGTVLNDANGQATQAVASMEDLLGGKTFAAGEQSIYVDYVKVTPENAQEYIK